jgi:hypothetical protein
MTFAAIIGHADEPSLLRRCIAHHLAIGVQWIFVSLNTQDRDNIIVAELRMMANVFGGIEPKYMDW